MAKVQKIVRGKWTTPIIYFLNGRTLRFSELKHRIPFITEANLTRELRFWEQEGLIHREVYKQVPPKVEYSLTDLGKDFLPVVEAVQDFADKYEAYAGQSLTLSKARSNANIGEGHEYN